MQIHRLIPAAGTLLLLGLSAAPAAAQEAPPPCSVTDADFAEGTVNDAETVIVSITGPLPVDASDTIGEVFNELDGQTRPVTVTLRQTTDEVDATVRGVTGELPVDIEQTLNEALGCEGTDAEDGPAPAGERGSDSSAAQDPCEVDVAGPTDEVETVVVGVTGPLPVDLSDTVGGVFNELDGQAGPVAVTVEETARGAEATVTGITGPLPVDIEQTLADALGCQLTTAEPADEPATDTDDETADETTNDETTNDDTANDDTANDETADAGTEAGADADAGQRADDTSDADAANSAEAEVLAGAASADDDGTLPRTGGGAMISLLGLGLVGAGEVLRRAQLPR